MGKVMTRVKLTNYVDADKAREGLLAPEAVRTAEVEALVDTGATSMAIPEDVRALLGLAVLGVRRAKLADGSVLAFPWVGGLVVEICGRETTCDALVGPAGTTPLVGQIPLEALDLLVDAKTGDVHVNPASPDMPCLDLLAVA